MDDRESDARPALSATTAEAVIARAGHIAAAGMPLAAGLRISASECDSWRLARGLRTLADQLELGRSLEDCLSTATRRLPPTLAGLIAAAQRAGAVGPMLAEWLENRRAARAQWRAVMAALAYPALTVLMGIGVYLEFAAFAVGPFRDIYREFGLKLPAATTYFLWSCSVAVPVLSTSLAAVVIVAAVARLLGGRAGWSWLVGNLPLVGQAWHWTGVAEMLRCLSLLVEHRVPLPEALRLTAGGVSDAYVAKQCQWLAGRVEQGTSLTMSLVHLRTLPLSIVPLVRWGEESDSLAAALRSAAAMIEGRLGMRSRLLVQIVPPVVFVLVGGTVVSGVIALFLPLVSLIQGLS